MGNWLPKSVLCLRSYTKRMFVADLLAGITVGLVALPLAMAFAIASGVPPQTGLYCAIVAGFTISALGGSSTQIGGPRAHLLSWYLGLSPTTGLTASSCAP
jgi:SulP family sulfate permease